MSDATHVLQTTKPQESQTAHAAVRFTHTGHCPVFNGALGAEDDAMRSHWLEFEVCLLVAALQPVGHYGHYGGHYGHYGHYGHCVLL